jgi:hypothetical protein
MNGYEDESLTVDQLIFVLAECRDAFPAPPNGDPREFAWAAAIADPLSVPAYVRAELAALRASRDALAEALRFFAAIPDHGEIWEVVAPHVKRARAALAVAKGEAS